MVFLSLSYIIPENNIAQWVLCICISIYTYILIHISFEKHEDIKIYYNTEILKDLLEQLNNGTG